MLKVLHGTSNANKEPLFLREWVLNGIQVVHFICIGIIELTQG